MCPMAATNTHCSALIFKRSNVYKSDDSGFLRISFFHYLLDAMKWVDDSTELPWDSGLVDKHTTQAPQVFFTPVIECKQPKAKGLLKLFIFQPFLAKTP